MTELTTRADGHILPEPIRHDVGKHRCPVCNHVCHSSKTKEDYVKRDVLGRPPETLEQLVAVIQELGSQACPISGPHLARRLHCSTATVGTYIYRARLAGYAIVTVGARGYYMEGEKDPAPTERTPGPAFSYDDRAYRFAKNIPNDEVAQKQK